ncbi:hypothetical protein RRG08_047426 [Elysia crispata]|uniref:Uncharacterized protein n=1 Tax=Elysia crispata TaxID=231223 RepID=A0AAE0YUE6_9GAST|nr:hypothetical protein RRG08_047426 [Elysia crispata]
MVGRVDKGRADTTTASSARVEPFTFYCQLIALPTEQWDSVHIMLTSSILGLLKDSKFSLVDIVGYICTCLPVDVKPLLILLFNFELLFLMFCLYTLLDVIYGQGLSPAILFLNQQLKPRAPQVCRCPGSGATRAGVRDETCCGGLVTCLKVSCEITATGHVMIGISSVTVSHRSVSALLAPAGNSRRRGSGGSVDSDTAEITDTVSQRLNSRRPCLRSELYKLSIPNLFRSQLTSISRRVPSHPGVLTGGRGSKIFAKSVKKNEARQTIQPRLTCYYNLEHDQASRMTSALQVIGDLAVKLGSAERATLTAAYKCINSRARSSTSRTAIKILSSGDATKTNHADGAPLIEVRYGNSIYLLDGARDPPSSAGVCCT